MTWGSSWLADACPPSACVFAWGSRGKQTMREVSFFPLLRPQSYQIRAHPMTLFNLNCLLMTLSPESLGDCSVGTLSRQSNNGSLSLSWTLNSTLLDDTLLSFGYRPRES